MKNGILSPQFPIELTNNSLPNDSEKSEAVSDMFSKNSQVEGLSDENRNYRKEEESKEKIKHIENNQNNTFVNDDITIIEVRDNIKNLSNKKVAVGLDKISNNMIKHFPDKIVLFLHKFFTKCWREGSLPDIWKQSIIVPILKNGQSPQNTNNYRPIVLASYCCKLLEKLYYNG